MDLRELGWGGTDWIDVAQHRERWNPFLNTVMNFPIQ
jgi:hypothetical protein